MENFATIGETQFAHLVNEKTNHVNMTCTSHAFYKEKTNHVNMTCTSYEQLPKREYGLLLRQMENWGIVAPKAIVKKYGVFLVKRAVEYTKATPNVKNPAGYMTYMLQQFKKDMQPAPKQEINKGTNCTPIEEKPAVRENRTTEKTEVLLEATTMSENKSFDKKGKTIPPTITKWQEAREFVAKIDEYDLTNSNILEFYKKIKKQYNFA
jgi:hypothetical protein